MHWVNKDTEAEMKALHIEKRELEDEKTVNSPGAWCSKAR